MGKTYIVTLAEDERVALQKLVSVGKSAARRLNHARILLLSDASPRGLRRTDQEIMTTFCIARCEPWSVCGNGL